MLRDCSTKAGYRRWTLLSLLNYMPYVLSRPTCLVPQVLLCIVPYVFSCLTCLVPYVLSCLACSCTSRASCRTYSGASLTSCLTCSHVSRVSRDLVPHCGVPCVFWVCSSLKFYVLFCSSSITYFRCFKPNMLLCISCIEALMPCTSCAFGALAI